MVQRLFPDPLSDKRIESLLKTKAPFHSGDAATGPGAQPPEYSLERHLMERAYGIFENSLIRPQAQKNGASPPYGFFAMGSVEPYTVHKALDGYARKSNTQNLAILDRQSSSCDRREFAARSASDKSLCIRSEAAHIRGIAFVWPR